MAHKILRCVFNDDEILILNGVSQHAFQNFLEIMRAQTNNKQTWMHKRFKCNIIKSRSDVATHEVVVAHGIMRNF